MSNATRYKSYSEADGKDFDFKTLDDGIITCSGTWTVENGPKVKIHTFFENDDRDISIRIWGIVNVTDAKKIQILELINDLNCQYRLAKFCFNKEANSLDLELDIRTIPDKCEPEIICRYQIAAGDILDDAYPKIMKVMWS